MIKFLYGVVILSAVHLCAQNNQELFLQGNMLYQQQEYAKALTAYEKIQNKSAVVLYNMGNAYSMLQEHVNALLFYKRAEKIAQTPLYDVIKERIYDVQTTNLSLDEKPSFFNKFVSRCAHSFSLLLWQILFLLLFFIFCWHITKPLHTLRLVSIGSLFLVMFFLAFILLVSYRESIAQKALIKEQASLFIGPSENLAVRETLKAGQEVSFIVQKDDWYKVRTLHGVVGWIPQEAIVII